MKNLKRICVVIGIAIFSLPAFSQTSTQFSVKDSASSEQVYVNVEKMAEFPGGNLALLQFIGQNIYYPTDAVDASIQGVVVVKFVIDKTGKAKNPEILRGVHPLLDKAAMDVILLLPNFIPAIKGGENVSTYYNVPIQFKLSK